LSVRFPALSVTSSVKAHNFIPCSPFAHATLIRVVGGTAEARSPWAFRLQQGRSPR
jgi:hypothetical protein